MKKFQPINKKPHIRCRLCGNPKIQANERIIKTKVCYNCTLKVVPKYIPKEQHIKYLSIKYEIIL